MKIILVLIFQTYMLTGCINPQIQQATPQKCWVEFLQVLEAGDLKNIEALMTEKGFDSLISNIDPSNLKSTLKRWGHGWQKWEIRWGEISKTNATAKLGPESKEKQLEFVKVNGLWKLDVLIHGD